MKKLNIIKYLTTIIAIVFIFLDWRVSIGLFIVATLMHSIPVGPRHLLNVITGYLAIIGVICLFNNWKIGIGLIVAASLTAKFNIWAAKVNHEYHKKNQKKSNQ